MRTSWVTNCAAWGEALPLTPGGIINVVGHWDATGNNFDEDLVGSCDLSTPSTGYVTFGSDVGMEFNSAVDRAYNSTLNPVVGLSAYGVTIVGEFPNLINGAVLFDMGATPANAGAAFLFSSTIHMQSASAVAVGAAAASTPRVWYFEFNGASSKYFVDGVQVGGTYNPGSNTPSASLTFGNLTGAGNGCNTVIAEAKLSSGTQTDTDIAAEAAALIAKWGI